MSEDAIAAVILAAGQGTRMKSKLPKVLHPLAGRSMLAQLLAVVDALGAERHIVVVSPGNGDAIRAAVPDIEVAVQDPPLGTGHAVMAARENLAGFKGDVLVLFADSPLVASETLNAMLAARHGAGNPAVVVMGFRPADAAEYARLILDDKGNLDRIVEHRDASEAERGIDLCNSGFMAIDGAILSELLDGVGNDNAKGEYYLTEIVEIANRLGRTCAVVEAGEIEAWGVNSRDQLAQAEAVVQNRLRHAAMAGGVTLLDPDSVHFCHDTILGQDVSIGPNVFFGPGVRVDDDVTIQAFSHLEGCHISNGANIGPFARLRPEAEIGKDVRIGNFVEVKKARIEDGAKVNHLSYIGDARVGEGANIGAGTITCNYDGFLKSFTDIGKGAFIGSNSALVAPVKIGDGAIVGAGSTVTRDVAADALAVERSAQKELSDWALSFRKRKSAEKAAQKKKS
ncbi:MAG: bifunctional UDP-N-acetylglucosamine diphosphorylase/glucosamine-1-phosphate N-acetyltransferase GlmU [Rhodospirillaceae bacterium]|jgi:bifunctional UDP-N-acetylglucosamine pyrophosphorylase/glucosamine-1-phosphate N-acetyltransferase|nr:bifunctional UDP-N-acetylglucosamine diphosphorylase/glucosamine-1-phosphate N-acetyltransferase GlmU [Rhodospirillaceae bacterium]MBT4687471.1 bifunctional UDP-N-acetylglucosamine diphosphorylase/glucosamine-1-phosphate N-acetyltransferase GlmU [Rhodospirillaceae bacterium]MBT5080173.1 bifunctional UDP-N-acetylglucosamine diphosphorylase/glucosamine-1-phosphate N-acetyltransferase GlmU [Rhodospirillaceae bacterium]MBT5527128.1 bifunctional UDP-N-acetylglucosamine diphosphorylase/glucosamine-